MSTELTGRFVSIIVDHERSHDHPFVGQRGDRVRVGHLASEWPGWTWCEPLHSGPAGWLPEVLLHRDEEDSAILTRDYSAMELTVRAGETLRALDVVAGWTWCERASGDAGWVPNAKIQLAR